MQKLPWLTVVLGCLLWAASADAKTVYVAKTGSDKNGCTSSSPCATITKGISAMAGGDTLIIGDGTYAEEVLGMPNGSASAYTTIQAAHDWAVTIDGSGLANNYKYGIKVSGKYVVVRGFQVKMKQSSDLNSGISVYGSDHVKIQRCSVAYAATTGNAAGIGVGPGADYTLIEECYVYGGSRYPYLVYQSTHTVVRRCVSRLDYWNSSLQAANFCNYNGDMTVWENDIAIDSDKANILGGSGFYAGFFNENKPPDSSWSGTATRETHRGNIVLNVNSEYSAILDSNMSNSHTYSDDIVWNSYGGYYGDYLHGDAPVLNATNLTIGHILGSYDAKDGQGSAGTGFFVGQGTGGTMVTNMVTNSIFWDNPSYGIADYAVGDYNSFWGNKANYGGSFTTPRAGANDRTTDLTAGLKYLPRIEAGSPLATAGSSGAQIGASVVFMWGITGTVWGEPGYDAITADPLWPYPNEDVIKAGMASYNGPGGAGARGFATGNSLDGSPQTLTKYIWEYLGNQIPPEVYGFHVVSGSLPSGMVAVAYDAMLAASGGTSPYTWSVTGTLPPGLTLDAMGGAITGTPTTAGTTSITLVASDSASPPSQAMAPVQILILPAPETPDGGIGDTLTGEGGGTGASKESAGAGGHSGCGCRVGARPADPVGAGALGALATAGLFLRRRRRERRAR